MDSPGMERLDAYFARVKEQGDLSPDEIELKKVADLNEKFGLKKEKVIDLGTTELVCEGCGMKFSIAGNVRIWTSEELRTLADLKDDLHRIADANREVA